MSKEERRNKLVNVLADVLTRLCERNDRLMVKNTTVTRFHALQPPQITINFYLKRIAQYSNCSEECFVLALIYIDRLIRKNGNFLVNSLNVHRLIITSIMLGAKFFDDQYFNNTYFGKIGGVSCKEINQLEIEFLFMINFNLFVQTDIYKTYNVRLFSQTLKSNGQKQERRSTESKDTQGDSKDPASVTNATKVTEKVSRAAVFPSRSNAPSTRPLKVVGSRPLASSSVVPRVRHYPTQRCTPPSPNFLQTTKRIHMKTR